MNKKCSTCGSTMIDKGSREIGGDTYYLLYCEKCNKQVARTE